MNKVRLQFNLYLNEVVFSYCGLFAIDSGVFGEKASGQGCPQRLFATVALPRFGLAHQFSHYPIPYEWLSDGSTLDAKAADAESEERQTSVSASVSHVSQHNTIGIFSPSVFYRMLIDKRTWHVADGFINGNLSKIRAATNTQSVGRSVNERYSASVPRESFYEKRTADQEIGLSSISLANELFTHDTKIKTDRKFKAGSVHSLFHTVEVTASQGPIQLLKQIFDNTTTQTATLLKGAQTSFVDSVHVNNNAIDDKKISVVLQQESIRRTIKTLASKRKEQQHQNNGQFEQLQRLLQKAEQLTNQELRRLQQSISELKNAVSAPQHPVGYSPPRPPSVYGRLK